MMIWVLLSVAAVVAAVAGIALYNGLVSLRFRADGAWSDVDVQLKRRHDLIPNLVECVKGYAAHERGVLERVTEARARAMTAAGPSGREASENQLAGALKSLFAVAENYPQLKASDSFVGLQRSLSEVEDALQNARRYFNAVVRDYNTRVEMFPGNLVARSTGFKKREFFQLKPGEGEVPAVSLRP